MKTRTIVYISIWLTLINIESKFKYNQSQPIISSILCALCISAQHLIVSKLLFNTILDTNFNKLFCLFYFVYYVYTIYNQKLLTISRNNERFYFEFV